MRGVPDDNVRNEYEFKERRTNEDFRVRRAKKIDCWNHAIKSIRPVERTNRDKRVQTALSHSRVEVELNLKPSILKLK